MTGGSVRVLAIGTLYPPHHLGGYEVVWRGAMRELRDRGHRVRILTTTYRRPAAATDAIEDPDVHRELEWYWHDHAWRSLGPFARMRLERGNAATFDRHLSEFRPDVVTWWPVGGLGLSLLERARRSGLPAVLFVHDYWPRYGPEHDLWLRMWAGRPLARAWAERATGVPTQVDLAAAGRWLFNSAVVRDDTAQTGLVIDDQAVLAPGVAQAYLGASPERDLPSWRWRLLYVGRVVEQKGVRTAVEALAVLPGEATLRIIGEGDLTYRRELERLAAELGVADRVRFEPTRQPEQLIGAYREADVLVFPVEWQEPWGLVPLEAMALGTPVVATGRGGSRDYLEPGVNCLLFEAGSASSLAAAISELRGSPELLGRLREGGRLAAARHSEQAFNDRAVDDIVAVAGARTRLPSVARCRASR